MERMSPSEAGGERTPVVNGGGARARRGRPPRIHREQIVEVASSFDAEILTMQAVADALGVDRKAINYHVSSRGDLLELVASEIFRVHMERVVVSADGDWRDVVRAFAGGMRDAVVATGSFAPYFKLPPGRLLGALEPVERVLQSLVRAGFDEFDAARTVNFVTEFVSTAARRQLAARGPAHTEVVQIQKILDQLPADELPVLRRVVSGHTDDWADSAVDFHLDVVIAGLGQLLAATATTGSPDRRRTSPPGPPG